ncbi:MAG: thioredoxin domain-containing protein [Chloroflexi bacterium]|nr:thioredoxin domain-containing protein [Chloroflexota bacterium]
MTASPKSRKRISKKQQRLAKKQRTSRLKTVRIGGIILIVVLALGGAYFWRTANQVPLAELQALVEPNIDGNVDAPVRIVEFADFGCPACRTWHNAGIKEQIQQDYGDQVAFEFRHFPVITAQSPQAAEAGQCAAEQDEFWTYHDYVYENTPQNALSRSDLKSYATAVGLNQAQFDECLDSGKYAPYVRHDWDAALDAGARGTPTFMVNGRRVNPSYNELAAIIEQELE